MYVHESVFVKYIDPYRDIESKKKSLFDKKTIRRCASVFATIAIFGIGSEITHNRLEQQKIKHDLATVVSNGDYSILNQINYEHKQQTINTINNITSEFSKVINPIIEQNTKAENYLSYHQDEQFAIEDMSETFNFNSDINSTHMKRAYILTQEMKKIYNTIKDNSEYKDIKNSVFIKMIKMNGDYNIIVKSDSFKALFAPSSYFLINTVIDTEKVSFGEWQDKLAKENIKPYSKNLKIFFERKIGVQKKQNDIEENQNNNFSKIERKNIVENVNNFMSDIDNNINYMSDGISNFSKSFNGNAKEISHIIDDMKKEGVKFNQKINEYHNKIQYNYTNIKKNYAELQKI